MPLALWIIVAGAVVLVVRGGARKPTPATRPEGAPIVLFKEGADDHDRN